jgi:2-phospho-L-lactate guanylyltransferase
MISALVPVKSLSAGKSRLAPVLPTKEREALSVRMLQKVLDALLHSRRFDWIGVVTNDRQVEALARDRNAHTIREEGQISENHSVAYASRICLEMGAESLLVIHADLPLVTAAEIETLAAMGGGGPKVVLCPSKEGTGTNALYRTPPEIIPACFGPRSFSRHLAEAEARQIPWERCSLPGITLDIDTPEDLKKLRPWPESHPRLCGAKEYWIP